MQQQSFIKIYDVRCRTDDIDVVDNDIDESSMLTMWARLRNHKHMEYFVSV